MLFFAQLIINRLPSRVSTIASVRQMRFALIAMALWCTLLSSASNACESSHVRESSKSFSLSTLSTDSPENRSDQSPPHKPHQHDSNCTCFPSPLTAVLISPQSKIPRTSCSIVKLPDHLVPPKPISVHNPRTGFPAFRNPLDPLSPSAPRLCRFLI